jgi:hypothetical protein
MAEKEKDGIMPSFRNVLLDLRLSHCDGLACWFCSFLFRQ